MKTKIGVIILPMIFGHSVWYSLFAALLAGYGYKTIIFNQYRGQKFPRPFFISLVNADEKAKLDTLASQFDDEAIEKELDTLILRLKEKGCRQIAMLGSSIGGVFAFHYAVSHPGDINQVIAWYPNLIFPENFKSPKGLTKLPPDLTKLKTKAHIFIGDSDTKLQPGTLKLIQQLIQNHPNITTDIYSSTDHAFFEPTIQHFFPNPFFRTRISFDSLKKTLRILAAMQ